MAGKGGMISLNKTKKILLYVIILVLFLFIGIAVKQINVLKDLETQTADVSYLCIRLLLIFLVYSVCGALLGSESFLKEKSRKGRWSVEISKILVLGIPSAFIGLYYILYYIFNYVLQITFLIQFNLVFLDFPAFVIIMQILFGYTVITSFYKNDAQQ